MAPGRRQLHNKTQVRRRTLAAVTMLPTIGLAVVACSSSGGGAQSTQSHTASSHTASTIGPETATTLQQWNWDTQADSPDSNAIMPAVIRGFEKKYPKITVKNTEMTLEEQNDKLPLAFQAASSAPTVSQTNEGFESMGKLVKDNELLSLNPYNQIYHWKSRVGDFPLQINSFESSGKQFGAGDIYGVPWTGVGVGIFYNKAMLKAVGGTPPTSWATFTHDLALLHKAGKTPMAYSGGQPTEYQPEHVLFTIMDQLMPAKDLRNFVFHTGSNRTIDTKAGVKAASIFASWAKDGYFNKGYQGTSDTQALDLFDSGKTGFFIEGNWHIGSVQKALGSKAGFWLPPTITGGTGEGWSIPAKSNDPNAAAAWIDWTVSPKVQAMQLKAGNIPVATPAKNVLAAQPEMVQTAAVQWKKRVNSEQIVPFLDWAAPPLLSDIQAQTATLLAGNMSPADYMKQLQSTYNSFTP